LANTSDAKYEHIPASERKKVLDDCDAANAWLFERLQAQDRLTKADAPAVTCDQIRQRQVKLENDSNTTMNKAKPAPPPEPKKEEAKKADEAKAAEPKKEEAPKAAEEPKK
jgi:heat shock protein 4